MYLVMFKILITSYSLTSLSVPWLVTPVENSLSRYELEEKTRAKTRITILTWFYSLETQLLFYNQKILQLILYFLIPGTAGIIASSPSVLPICFKTLKSHQIVFGNKVYQGHTATQWTGQTK